MGINPTPFALFRASQDYIAALSDIHIPSKTIPHPPQTTISHRTTSFPPFRKPDRLLHTWIDAFVAKVVAVRPLFVALHLQEVGGKTYEKSMEYVQDFIRILCEMPEMERFVRIRVYLDEDYTSAEHFTVSTNPPYTPSLFARNRYI